ncbi:MAG: hypothetical protein QM762_09180 [Chryseolinea sp.]
MRLLFLAALICFQSETATRFYPVLLKDNIVVPSFDVSKSVKLNDKEFVLIAKSKQQSGGKEGHRLLYLSADSLSAALKPNYISTPKGEAYVYNPYFFKFSDEIILVVEEGYEYMSGVDIFRINNTKVDFLGYVPVAGSERNSIVEQMRLVRQLNSYQITFSGKIGYKIGTDNIIDGSKIVVNIDQGGLKIIEY